MTGPLASADAQLSAAVSPVVPAPSDPTAPAASRSCLARCSSSGTAGILLPTLRLKSCCRRLLTSAPEMPPARNRLIPDRARTSSSESAPVPSPSRGNPPVGSDPTARDAAVAGVSPLTPAVGRGDAPTSAADDAVASGAPAEPVDEGTSGTSGIRVPAPVDDVSLPAGIPPVLPGVGTNGVEVCVPGTVVAESISSWGPWEAFGRVGLADSTPSEAVV